MKKVQKEDLDAKEYKAFREHAEHLRKTYLQVRVYYDFTFAKELKRVQSLCPTCASFEPREVIDKNDFLYESTAIVYRDLD